MTTMRLGSTPGAADFTTMILDNLRKAGVQNTRRAERLVFERLDPWPGAWIQAAGEFKDKGGTARRVAAFSSRGAR
jgi:adenine-specific DNA-methyltransferase